MKPEVSTTMRHVYAIKVLEKLPGLFKPHRYFYHCARCKWSFVVNDGRRGAITAVDDKGIALDRNESIRRVASFVAGPCPSMNVLSAPPPRRVVADSVVAAILERRRRADLCA